MLHERTIDDLVGHVLANIVDRGGTHYADCEFDGQRHLVCVARTLAREVERLRAEVVQLNEAVEHRRRGEAAAAAEVERLRAERDALIEVVRRIPEGYVTPATNATTGEPVSEMSMVRTADMDALTDACRRVPLALREMIMAGKPAGGEA